VPATKRGSLPIRSQDDVVSVRQAVRRAAVDIGLNLIDQTKVVTAASELARNAFVYGHGGDVLIEEVQESGRRGLRLSFEDHGPGIPDIEKAMVDGYTSGNGLGLGLGGAKRLSDEFQIFSEQGAGTRVVITRWKS
jgi:serine/threonine-protein kinase RsbT